MENEDIWTLLASVMPEGIEVIPEGDEALIKSEENELNVVYNPDKNSYTMNGKTIHFQDTEMEVVNTILVPFILQELDGQPRI